MFDRDGGRGKKNEGTLEYNFGNHTAVLELRNWYNQNELITKTLIGDSNHHRFDGAASAGPAPAGKDVTKQQLLERYLLPYIIKYTRKNKIKINSRDDDVADTVVVGVVVVFNFIISVVVLAIL